MRSKTVITILLIIFILSIIVCSLWTRKTREKSSTTPKTNNIVPKLHDNQYCLGQNFLVAKKRFETDDGLIPVTFTTHGSFDIMNYIEENAATWEGPISFALFLDFHSQKALDYVTQVYECNKDFQDKVTVHIGFRISPFQDKCQPIEIPKLKVDCADFLHNQKAYQRQVDGPFGLYPFNVMRNLARHGAQTDLHFVLDADMIISDGFAEKVKKIANQMLDGKKKNALVIRRFETDLSTEPKNLIQLKASFDREAIFEFHHKWFFVGHHIPDVSKWFEKSMNSQKTETWKIPYLGNQWETPTIVHRNSEYNAEYFPPRIRVVQSMIYKLCRANYEFHLVSQVFATHRGIKTEDTMFSKVVQNHSYKYGQQRALDRYVREMDQRFPDTIERCGAFQMY